MQKLQVAGSITVEILSAGIREVRYRAKCDGDIGEGNSVELKGWLINWTYGERETLILVIAAKMNKKLTMYQLLFWVFYVD